MNRLGDRVGHVAGRARLLDAKDRVDLIRPLNAAGLNVPYPHSQTGNPLGLLERSLSHAQCLLRPGQGLAGTLVLSADAPNPIETSVELMLNAAALGDLGLECRLIRRSAAAWESDR